MARSRFRHLGQKLELENDAMSHMALFRGVSPIRQSYAVERNRGLKQEWQGSQNFTEFCDHRHEHIITRNGADGVAPRPLKSLSFGAPLKICQLSRKNVRKEISDLHAVDVENAGADRSKLPQDLYFKKKKERTRSELTPG
ncbi:uncharacterized protein MEPE_04682 [Melanopsichium pennsylvanicum]|uniref:Uncharacterized protein n=1 Tax=Melanopsichium pennsylvanicum TaxID=63383 RepID=A0AAJ4XRY1_9BASI|nr:uncharacterized protein MEPE_04682 [Melanopsichium pennsylvanicum]